MKTVRIRFSDLTHLGNGLFAEAAVTILECLKKAGSLFPSLPVSTEILAAEIKNLNTKNALADSNDGSHNTRNERSAQRKVVYEMLVLNGQYALGIANAKATYEEGKALLELSGYPAASGSRSPIEKIPVKGLVVTPTATPGIRKVMLRWKKGKCPAFLVQGTQGNPSSQDVEWSFLTGVAGNKCELSLPPGNWSIRVVGVYHSGHAAPANYVTVIVG